MNILCSAVKPQTISTMESGRTQLMSAHNPEKFPVGVVSGDRGVQQVVGHANAFMSSTGDVHHSSNPQMSPQQVAQGQLIALMNLESCDVDCVIPIQQLAVVTNPSFYSWWVYRVEFQARGLPHYHCAHGTTATLFIGLTQMLLRRFRSLDVRTRERG